MSNESLEQFLERVAGSRITTAEIEELTDEAYDAVIKDFPTIEKIEDAAVREKMQQQLRLLCKLGILSSLKLI